MPSRQEFPVRSTRTAPPAAPAAAGSRIDLAASVLLGIALFLGLRAGVLERYLVPTASMEPTLHGDPERGDRVLVAKLGRRLRDLERFDLVVVRAGRQRLVKRVLSAPAGGVGEYLALRQGDLFVGPSPDDLRRLRKDPRGLAARAMRVMWWRQGSATERGDEVPWEGWDGTGRLPSVPEDAGSWSRPDSWRAHSWTTAADVDASFVDADGERRARGRGYVRDVGVEFVLDVVDEGAGVLVDLEVYRVPHVFRVGYDGRVELAQAGPDGATDGGPFAGTRLGRLAPLRPGVLLRFGILDGRPFAESEAPTGRAVRTVMAADTVRVPVRLPGPRDDQGSLVLPPSRTQRVNRISVAALAAPVVVRELQIFHDLHYRPEPRRVFTVDPGDLFLVGDHSYESSDSRSRSAREPFRRTDLVGWPVAVLGPWPRTRWLDRKGGHRASTTSRP